MDKDISAVDQYRRSGFRFGAVLGIVVGLVSGWSLSDGAKDPYMLYFSITALCSIVFACLSYVTFGVIKKRKLAKEQ